MKKIRLKKGVILLFVLLFIVTSFIINNHKALVFCLKRVVYPKYKLVNEYFQTNLIDNTYIDKYKITSSGIELVFRMEVELNIPSEEIDQIFLAYSDYPKKKGFDSDYPGFQSQLGITTKDYDYYLHSCKLMEKHLFFMPWEGTQCDTYLLFKKPVDGKTDAYLSTVLIGFHEVQ